jgi:hypothetical protein
MTVGIGSHPNTRLNAYPETYGRTGDVIDSPEQICIDDITAIYPGVTIQSAMPRSVVAIQCPDVKINRVEC